MKRSAGAACLVAVTAALSMGPDQIESKHALRDASADTDPNSAFWRGATPVLAEGDREGNPVPGHRTEIRSRWTGRNLYFLFTCPYEQLNLKPEPRRRPRPISCGNGMWPKCLSVRTLRTSAAIRNSRSRRRENGSISISIWTLRGMKTDGCGTPDSRSPPASTRPLRRGTRSCGFPTRPWIHAPPQPAIPSGSTSSAGRERRPIVRRSSGNRLTVLPFTSRRFSGRCGL